MKKINNSGFVLVETLVVAVFVMAIFAILYNNFYPLMAEYEKREVYDDIDSKYGTYWIKRLIQENSYNATNMINNVNSTKKYYKFTCNDITSEGKKKTCQSLIDRLSITNVYVTKYNLVEFKNYVQNNSTSFSSGVVDYINYLPEYSKVPSLNMAQYRVIVEFHHKISTEDGTGDEYYSYGTIEVKK